MFDDEMWERSRDDYSVKDEKILIRPGCIWLKCSRNKPMGLAQVSLQTSTVVGVHIHILKEHRGKHTKEVGQNVLRWIKDNAGQRIKKVNTKVPMIYKDVIRFAHSLGFKDEGIDRGSIMKNGQLTDRLNLGILIEDIL